ncbi:bifunctional metallophosphatase/5'-nucleotidase [bacterium]|nr:bifunctional metallophosphatase/5'-nucleotidase [bacterium]
METRDKTLIPIMRHFICVCLSCFIILLSPVISQVIIHSSDVSPITQVSFLCMNDFQAAVEPVRAGWLEGRPLIGGVAALAGYVKRMREKDSNLIWVVAGDMFMGHYIDSLTHGRAMIEFLNLIPPDCFALGNHEFDYGIDNLRQRIEEAKFPVICANLMSREGKPFVRPYIIHKTGGLKILFIGVICQNLFQIVSVGRLKDIVVTDPAKEIIKWTSLLGKEIDLTVVVSHAGLSEDRRIASCLPPESGVDIIIGGHSHDLMEQAEIVNGIIICQAGSNGQYLGCLKADVDRNKKKIVAYSWRLIPTIYNKEIRSPDVEDWLKKRLESIAPQMEEVIGRLEGEWGREKGALEWAVADFATDAIEEEMGVDIGIYNRGGIRKSMKGPLIRTKDIFEIFPFGNYMVRFRLTGSQIETLIERHLIFSGQHLFFSKGLRYTFDPKMPAGKRLKTATVHGKPLDKNRVYTLATIEYLWGHSKSCFGLSHEDIKANGEWRECLDVIDRDILIRNIKRRGLIKANIDGRVKSAE